MLDPLMLITDVAAIVLLAAVLYRRRHRHHDMMLAYIVLNIGVLAVASILTGLSVTIGVGLGLFGVLSIIRLRSHELTHSDVAYYFAALALGLICGLHPDPVWLAPVLSVLVVAVVAVVDHPALRGGNRQQLVVLDHVYPTEEATSAALSDLLGARITHLLVQQTDLVRDQMVVDVRYRLLPVADRTGGTDTVGSADQARTALPSGSLAASQETGAAAPAATA